MNLMQFQHSRALNQATLLSAVALNWHWGRGRVLGCMIRPLCLASFTFFFLWLNNTTLYSYECVLSHFSHAILRTVAHQLLCPWDSPGKNTGVGCHAFFQAQGSTHISLSFLHWQAGSLSSITWEALYSCTTFYLSI